MKKTLLYIFGIFLVIAISVFSAGSSCVNRSISSDNIPDTPEAKEIMKTIERAYDIEKEAMYTFNLKKFPTVFINDPRFPVSPSALETVRDLTKNPSLESAGYLDYKMAYYSWMRDATLHAEAVYAKAKAENRGLTEDERKSLVDSKGRTAPARVKDPIRHRPLIFMSVTINDDIAKVILDDGPTTIELTVVLVDKKWYIADIKGIAFHP